jgi:hypothetical protein
MASSSALLSRHNLGRINTVTARLWISQVQPRFPRIQHDPLLLHALSVAAFDVREGKEIRACPMIPAAAPAEFMT